MWFHLEKARAAPFGTAPRPFAQGYRGCLNSTLRNAGGTVNTPLLFFVGQKTAENRIRAPTRHSAADNRMKRAARGSGGVVGRLLANFANKLLCGGSGASPQ